MTYAALDTSVDRGAPFELYEFAEGARTWRYTTSPHADTWDSQQWLPRPISREAISRDSGSIGDPLQVTLPDNDPLALELLSGLTMHQVTLRVRQVHRGDLDQQARILFTGLVSGVSFRGASAIISCASRYAMVSKRRIAPTTFQAACNLTWGSARCGINPELYRVVTTVTASDQVGRVISMPALAGYLDGHFNGGQVVFGDTRRFVEKHTAGGVLTLSYPLGGLTSTPTELIAYPNCKKTEEDCVGRYNNVVNYLGWTRLPSVNPYNRSAYYLEDAVAVAPPAGSTGDLPGHPGYQIILAPVTLSFIAWNNAELTIKFESNGVLSVSRLGYTYDPGSSGAGESATVEPGWFVSLNETTPAPGMWASPAPVPGYGDIEIRAESPVNTGSPHTVNYTGFGTWNPPDAPFKLDSQGLAGHFVITLRVRNKTTGILIAQGDLTLDIVMPEIDQTGQG